MAHHRMHSILRAQANTISALKSDGFEAIAGAAPQCWNKYWNWLLQCTEYKVTEGSFGLDKGSLSASRSLPAFCPLFVTGTH